ncbi:hypothetical protein DFA_02093 [Cavenderia fasciculata]|uniref:Uncharacterized protein n=1 Tax=Cavenderia fasciculata TaxID=261658 RepID=F4PYP0_CACFS|nr:uncharacterized protein DFA_02093 [Cavenderia fasciculata]EGG19306.1 hypothetical protein DFA_02093 [Cavenderia fasciculata]|eukprot:XP_004357577.1 hypothetical protein DFA_02093 [Cavenderia fasciculata]
MHDNKCALARAETCCQLPPQQQQQQKHLLVDGLRFARPLIARPPFIKGSDLLKLDDTIRFNCYAMP